MDIETKKSFNKLKHYLTSFNNAYFDKDHMWILYETGRMTKPKLYYIDNKTIYYLNNKTILGIDYLSWI